MLCEQIFVYILDDTGFCLFFCSLVWQRMMIQQIVRCYSMHVGIETVKTKRSKKLFYNPLFVMIPFTSPRSIHIKERLYAIKRFLIWLFIGIIFGVFCHLLSIEWIPNERPDWNQGWEQDLVTFRSNEILTSCRVGAPVDWDCFNASEPQWQTAQASVINGLAKHGIVAADIDG